MLNDADAALGATLEAALSPGGLRTVEPRYLEEPRGSYTGRAGLVVAPRDAQEVAKVVQIASAAQAPVIPYSGGTGLVAGQVMPDGPLPLLLSLERMSAIRAVYPEENVMIAEAGAILADVQTAAAEAGRLFPLSLASEGSARIGGLLGTNAGGVNVLRYGNMRELCLGLEVVMPNGEIWHGLKRLRKDNTGYDLRHLMIGSEGTLGVITAASLKLYPRPASETTGLLVVDSPAGALKLLNLAKNMVGEGISAFELLAGQGIAFLERTMPELRIPFADRPPWMVLIDLGLAKGLDAQSALEEIFSAGMEAGLVNDGMVAASEAQRAELWAIRENFPEANKRIGAISSHDISLPLGEIPAFIARADAEFRASGKYRINCFGHLGDGNLHYNFFPLEGETKAQRASEKPEIMRALHDIVHEFGGSFSAEHGVGRLKVGDLERYGDPTKLAAMRAIKTALDPLGIMNPGAVLR